MWFDEGALDDDASPWRRDGSSPSDRGYESPPAPLRAFGGAAAARHAPVPATGTAALLARAASSHAFAARSVVPEVASPPAPPRSGRATAVGAAPPSPSAFVDADASPFAARRAALALPPPAAPAHAARRAPAPTVIDPSDAFGGVGGVGVGVGGGGGVGVASDAVAAPLSYRDARRARRTASAGRPTAGSAAAAASDTAAAAALSDAPGANAFAARSGGGGGPAALPAGSLLAELRMALPCLSSNFACDEADAAQILGFIGGFAGGVLGGSVRAGPSGGGGGNGGVAGAAGAAYGAAAAALRESAERVQALEVDLRFATQRAERRGEEAERLRCDVGEARQKCAAVEAQARQAVQLLSQKREEVRKQLLAEESRSQRLQVQNKALQTELEKLRARVHGLMQK